MILLKKIIRKITTKNILYLKEDKMSSQDYVSVKAESGYVIICKIEKVDFLSDLISESESILSVNGICFTNHIKTVIEDDSEFKSAFTASAICLQNLDSWMNSSDKDVIRLVCHVVNLALLSREFSNNKWYSALGFFSRKKNRELKEKAILFVNAHSISPKKGQSGQFVNCEF